MSGRHGLRLAGIVLAIALAALAPDASSGLRAAEPAPGGPASTQPATSADAPGPAAPSGAALSSEDLGRYFDGLIPYALQEGDIAGGEVVVVRDGAVLFAKGYGLADVASRRPVSADETVFRAGSVSKLFTWTAVMQLVEQGKLGLDHDVNDYLDFRIPDGFGRPITLRDLMTHTAGFEISAENLIDYDPRRLRPLGEVVRTNIPERIFPPGEVVAYSNYGAALAGYLVERISGEPFADYVEHHIFQPLGMTGSSFAQPLPATLRDRMASGYTTASGDPQPFELIGQSPAGALATTGTDMGRFMIAQLDDGGDGSARLLSPETARLMHARQRTEAPGVNGFALGFYEESRNGQRIIGHGGDTQFFHTDLHLLPDARLGLYVAFNSRGKDGAVYTLRTALFDGFLDRYFPAPIAAPAAMSSATADARAVAGSYISSDRQESSIFRVFTLFGESAVTAAADGTIEVSSLTGLDGQPYRWQEIGPLLYRDQVGRSRLAFVRRPDGRIDHAAWSGDPTYVLQPAPIGEGAWVLPALAGAIAVLLLTVLTWLGGWVVRRGYRARLDLERRQLVLRRLARIAALVWIAAFAGWSAVVLTAQSDIAALSDALVPVLVCLYLLGVLGLAGSLVTVIAAASSWRSPTRGRFASVGDTALAAAACYLAWFAVMFNLVSFATRF